MHVRWHGAARGASGDWSLASRNRLANLFGGQVLFRKVESFSLLRRSCPTRSNDGKLGEAAVNGPAQENCALLVQVEHPCVLESDQSWWSLLRDECPQQAWGSTAILLACLESLYRVEYSQAAENAIAALNAANSAPVPTKIPEASNDEQSDESHERRDGELSKEDAAAAAAAAAVKAAITAVTASPTTEPENDAPPEPSAQEQLLDAAKQADAELAAWVMFLATRSQFQTFTRRDSELGKTLNQGYLDQLFIKSNARRLDQGFLQAFAPENRDKDADWQFLEDNGVVVLKRGFSSERATGRLLLQKLDYLQTAVVEKALGMTRSKLASWWRQLLSSSQRSLDDATKSLAKESTENALPPSLLERMAMAGSRAVAWLSERGAAPIIDSLALPDIDRAFPVREPARLPPLHLRVVGLKEVLEVKSTFQKGPKAVLELLLQPLELEEPSLKEVAVLYRRACGQNKQGVLKRAKSVLTTIGQRIGVLQSAQDPASSTLRPQISLQIYRDIPLPTWSVVLPEKVLQFRPLDFLRTDLFAISGLIAALAQARYDSFYLEVVTTISATIFVIRIVLGYRRQVDRYRVRLAEILREKTVATDGTAIQYLAASAADQQFQLAALCYILLLQQQQQQQQTRGATGNTLDEAGSERLSGVEGRDLDDLAARAEQLLARRGLQVRFDVDQAMDELLRRGLVRKRNMDPQQGGSGAVGCEGMFYAVEPQGAQQLLEDQWSGILWARVRGTLEKADPLL